MFTPQEAEEILRGHWDDATIVGGFHSPSARELTLSELEETYGADTLKGWTLIGETSWSDYEEGGATYLFIKEEDQDLWSLNARSTVYGDYGESFDEIDRTTVEEWLETVKKDHEHAETFPGY